MKTGTKLKPAVAFVTVMSLLAGAWPLALLGLAAAGLWGFSKFRAIPDGMRGGAKALAVLAFAAPINFAALIASRRWGLYAICGVAALMLLDASFGDDGIGFPMVGWVPIFLVALVVGGYDWWRRKAPFHEQVEDAVYAAVAGHRMSKPPQIIYGEGPMAGWFGKFQPPGVFAFHVPPQQRSADFVDVEQHLREVLPAAPGTSWAFVWNTRIRHCKARVVPDLPESIWHPAADGSLGNPLAPKGDPYRIPLAVVMGGEEVFWTPRTNPHLLTVGTTGGGKSGVIRAVMEYVLLHRSAWEIRMIDPKFSEFAEYMDYPGAVDAVALELDESLVLLQEARAEMLRRQRLLRDFRVQNLDELNAVLESRGEARLKRLLIVIDEVAEFLEKSGGRSEEAKEADAIRDECSAIFESIARLGRAMGVHLLYATQRNDASLISGQVRNNTMARLAVGRLSPEGSRMALDNGLATTLSGAPGRGIYYEFGVCREVQVYRVDQANIREMIGVSPEEAARL